MERRLKEYHCLQERERPCQRFREDMWVSQSIKSTQTFQLHKKFGFNYLQCPIKFISENNEHVFILFVLRKKCLWIFVDFLLKQNYSISFTKWFYSLALTSFLNWISLIRYNIESQKLFSSHTLLGVLRNRLWIMVTIFIINVMSNPYSCPCINIVFIHIFSVSVHLLFFSPYAQPHPLHCICGCLYNPNVFPPCAVTSKQLNCVASAQLSLSFP